MAEIDPDFKDKLSVTTKHEEYGYSIWGEFNPPEKLGIHGDNVAVDFDICVGDGVCLDVCPEEVYVLVEYDGHPTGSTKAAPANQDKCIECLACETDCPVVAIKIFEL
ncbi:MAG: ferredoxin family protein [Candidatus Heimdallarchaeota archaeon]|nr:ferredoxin family protein [Candidatus Heimdallarchaeota archaeon]